MSMLSRTITVAATAALGVGPLACAHSAASPAPAATVTPAPALAAATTSPFVGTWELNVAKSDFGPAAASAPTKSTMTITKAGNVVTLAQAVTMGGQDVNVSTDYAMIGHDTTTNAPDGLPVTNNASMTDSSATIASKLQRQGMDITITNHWALSGDRKALTIVQETASPMGAMKMTLVYDRKQ
jgi:hypothetical protein